MAKTAFVDGTTVVTADFLNSIFNTTGGHRHDGGVNDGSANQIDLETEVDWGTGGSATVFESGGSVTLILTNSVGTFSFALDGNVEADNLNAVSLVSTDTIIPRTGATVEFYDAGGPIWRHIHCGDVTAEGDVTAAAGTVSGNAIASTTSVTGATASFTTAGITTVNADDVNVNATLTVDSATGDIVADQVPPIVARVDGTGDPTCTVTKDALGAITSVAHTATTGVYTVTLASAVAATSVPTLVSASHTACRSHTYNWSTTTSLEIKFWDDTGSPVDVDSFTLVIWDF